MFRMRLAIRNFSTQNLSGMRAYARIIRSVSTRFLCFCSGIPLCSCLYGHEYWTFTPSFARYLAIGENSPLTWVCKIFILLSNIFSTNFLNWTNTQCIGFQPKRITQWVSIVWVYKDYVIYVSFCGKIWRWSPKIR